MGARAPVGYGLLDPDGTASPHRSQASDEDLEECVQDLQSTGALRCGAWATCLGLRVILWTVLYCTFGSMLGS